MSYMCRKALDKMNVQIHRVLNDITGVNGMKIVDAILVKEIPSHWRAFVMAESRTVKTRSRSPLRTTIVLNTSSRSAKSLAAFR